MTDKKAELSPNTIRLYEDSLRRCIDDPKFLDLFYDKFLASSPEVRAKFENTNFTRQKREVRGAFYLIVKVVGGTGGDPENYLKDVAIRHGRHHLNIGAALYDLWLDSLLETVKECDPEYSPAVLDAWDRVMVKGIDFMLDYYHHH